MGNFIKIAGVNPPTTRPRVDLMDSMLVHGSLMLLDPSNIAAPWSSGVPVTDSILRNLADNQASELLGVNKDSLGAVVTYGNMIAGKGVLERTAKGGLHAALVSNAAIPYPFLKVKPSVPIAAYVMANPTHHYFISTWFQGTRFGEETGAVTAIALNDPPAPTTLLTSFAQDGKNYPEGATRLGFRRTQVGSTSSWRPQANAGITPGYKIPVLANIGVAGYAGTPTITDPALFASNHFKLFGVAAAGPYGSTTGTGGSGVWLSSRALYRSYIEDLTVSGRTYAQVDALDHALFTREVLTAGGRYFGDTFTDPATVI